jgi:hypothetical protein
MIFSYRKGHCNAEMGEAESSRQTSSSFVHSDRESARIFVAASTDATATNRKPSGCLVSVKAGTVGIEGLLA